MLVLGHLGVTLGIIKILEKSDELLDKRIIKTPIDYRLVLVGALLPDLIDKPLILFLTNKHVGPIKSIAHSLFFVFIMLIPALIGILEYKKKGILILTLCSFIHQILDGMWMHPSEFLWPIYGLGNFDSGKSLNPIAISGKSAGSIAIKGAAHLKNIYSYVSGINLMKFYSIPYFFISDIIGGIIILYFFIPIILNKKFKYFIISGNL